MKLKNLSVLTLLLLLFPLCGFAQMFSVGESENRQASPLGNYSSVSAGLDFGQFDYQGSSATESERLDFDSPILRFRLETRGLDITMGLGGSLTGMENTSFLNIAGRIFNEFAIYRKQNILIGIPVQISTDLKSIQKNNSSSEFQQNSFLFGTGISSFFRLSDNLELSLRTTPNYGFSFSQGNLFGGSLFRWDGKSQLFIGSIFGENGLSIGYHFDYREYRIEGDLNDYNYTSHSVTIGYAF